MYDENGGDTTVVVEDNSDEKAAEEVAETVAETIEATETPQTAIMERLAACLERVEVFLTSMQNPSTLPQSTTAEDTMAEAMAVATVLTAEAEAKQTNAETKIMLEQAEQNLAEEKEEVTQENLVVQEDQTGARRTTWI